MDLAHLTGNNNHQLDSVIRRPSLSSLSSASGYDSSNYVAAQTQTQSQSQPQSNSHTHSDSQSHVQSQSQTNGQNHPSVVVPLRISTGLNTMYLTMLDNSSNTNLVSTGTLSTTDVGPWVEQQKQQQSLNMTSLDNGKKEHSSKLPLVDQQLQQHQQHQLLLQHLHVDQHLQQLQQHHVDQQQPVPMSITPNMTSSTNNDSIVDDDELDVDDDELIPTAIVIKNIPFAIKKEQLLDVMTKLGLPLPYAFNYHFDNGVFRGLAFANFTSTDETSAVVNRLNGREIGGRKLRVEYKKMLPVQERERIEREKREKRGQLEEQHRSASNASLASLISVTSTTAATKNLSVNGQSYVSQTERLFAQYPTTANKLPLPPADLDFNDPEVLELYSQLLTYRDDNSKLIFELAFPTTLSISQRKTLSLMCQFLNLLELFDNGLIIIRRKPGQQSIQQRQQQSASYTHAHALQLQAPASSLTPAASVLGHQQLPAQVAAQNGGLNNVGSLHSSSMMNLNQIPTLLGQYGNSTNSPVAHAPELLRSQSQSALQLPRARQQTSTPIQSLYSQYHNSSQSKQQPSGSGKYANFGVGVYSQNASSVGGGNVGGAGGQGQMGTPTSSSAAALLRSSNNRSFVDVRSSSNLNNLFQSVSAAGSPTPQHLTLMYQQPQYFLGNQGQQVQVPQGQMGSQSQVSQGQVQQGNLSSLHSCKDLQSRFNLLGLHSTSNLVSLQPSTSLNDEFQMGEPLTSKLSAINLGTAYEHKQGSGIWGYKR